MSATSSISRRRSAEGHRSETHATTSSRRGAHTVNRTPDGEARQSLHVTPNAVVVTGGVWDLGTAKRFGQWFFDGATDRPHLRF